MIKNKNLNRNFQADQLIILAFLIIMPFEMVNHSLIYTLMELLFVNSAFMFYKQFPRAANDIFFKGYLLIVVWCLIVTCLSPVAKQSFKSTTQWFLPLLMFFPFYLQTNLYAILRRYLWLPTLILFLQSVVLFIYFKMGAHVITDNSVLNFLYFLNWEWTGKVYTSTIVLCLIVLTCSVIDNKLIRNILCGVNLASGILCYDRAFIFSLLILILLFIYLKIKHKISVLTHIGAIIGAIAVIGLSFFVVHNVLKLNLHIIERFAVYDYWLPKLLISPIHGVGVGIPSLQYYLLNYPVPQHLLDIDIGMKTHAHNVFLDIALTQGFVGLLIFVSFIGLLLCNTIRNRINPLRYTFLFMVVAVFSKFMVDDRFEAHMMIVFWFFLLSSYTLSLRVNGAPKR